MLDLVEILEHEIEYVSEEIIKRIERIIRRHPSRNRPAARGQFPGMLAQTPLYQFQLNSEIPHMNKWNLFDADSGTESQSRIWESDSNQALSRARLALLELAWR